MSVFLITLQAVFALLGIGLLGFWIIGRRRVPSETLAFLSTLAIDIALPLLVLSNLISDFSPREFPDWWHMPLWWLGFTAVALALSLSTSFLVRKELRSEFSSSLFYQNGLFVPILILGGVFGPGNPYLVPLFLFMVFFPSMVFSTYTLFFGKRIQKERLNWRRIINPVLVATIVGLVIGLFNIRSYIPDFLIIIVTMVGAIATPLFMLILGGNIYNDVVRKADNGRQWYAGEVLKFVAVKNILFPAVFVGLLLLLRPDFTVGLIIMLQAAVPPITAIPILVERCGGNRRIASQFVAVSLLASIFSIPAFIYMFSRFFPLPL
ncbi:MAG: AEC family transporter [Dehalococcoidia bacterium]|nr:AEC family transporter [Dehalococcoidia bacterium]